MDEWVDEDVLFELLVLPNDEELLVEDEELLPEEVEVVVEGVIELADVRGRL